MSHIVVFTVISNKEMYPSHMRHEIRTRDQKEQEEEEEPKGKRARKRSKREQREKQ